MSVNSTFVDTPHLPSNSSLPPLNCLTFTMSMLIFTTFSVTNIALILPLSTLIFYLGYQHSRKRRYISTKAASSHSDIFTYHMVTMETIAVSGCLLYCVGVNSNLPVMFTYGFYIFLSPWSMKVHFHTLTCVEHYLAVVHPVTYLGLKNTGGVRIRNISIGCVWLLCFVWEILVALTPLRFSMILHICFVAFDLIVVCFCCISVLCTLRRPGLGGVGRVSNQMKQRAFKTVVTIMSVLWLCLGGMLVSSALVNSQMLRYDNDECTVIMSSVWFSVPSSLVLPLLYLHRAGKLPVFKQ